MSVNAQPGLCLHHNRQQHLYGLAGQPRENLPALPGDRGYFLHAQFLNFHHPITGEQINLEAALPSGFSLHQSAHGANQNALPKGSDASRIASGLPSTWRKPPRAIPQYHSCEVRLYDGIGYRTALGRGPRFTEDIPSFQNAAPPARSKQCQSGVNLDRAAGQDSKRFTT